MAKLFGYSSYEEQIKNLNKIEKQKIMQHELLEQAQAAKEQAGAEDVTMVDDEDNEEADDPDYNPADDSAQDDHQSEETIEIEATSEKSADETKGESNDTSVDMDVAEAESVPAPITTTSAPATENKVSTSVSSSSAIKSRNTSPKLVAKRRNHISVEDDDDGNDADSEQDGNDAEEIEVDDDDQDAGNASKASDAVASSPAPKKDRAAAYRRLLQAEALQNRQRKRLKQTGDFVEAEAEEDEEDDVLKIGGLGDFGFGVPQAKTQESKEAEEERNALKLREDDLEGIVDDLSDDEREQAQDLDELFRKELEDQDRQQVKEVMRNVKEGFGRNRRAFSSGLMGAEARGRFNLDELVAADGKMEAARLGLLESDEEFSDAEGKKKGVNDDEDEEGGGNGGEEDEEAEMERMLRDRFKNQPKIYITSSESENEDEEDRDALNGTGAADENEVESDEERERQQMKLFSERARINRRMQRMKDMQRQVAVERDDVDSSQKSVPVVPNLLLEEDEDSQEVWSDYYCDVGSWELRSSSRAVFVVCS